MPAVDKNRLFFTVFGFANLGLLLYGLIALAAPAILFESFSRNVYQFPAGAGLVDAPTSLLKR
jgi:hypothetical protein